MNFYSCTIYGKSCETGRDHQKEFHFMKLVTTVNLPIVLKLRTQRLGMCNGIMQRLPLGELCVTSQNTAAKETTFRRASEKLIT